MIKYDLIRRLNLLFLLDFKITYWILRFSSTLEINRRNTSYLIGLRNMSLQTSKFPGFIIYFEKVYVPSSNRLLSISTTLY